MGANMSFLARAIRAIFCEPVRDIFEYSRELLLRTRERRLSLRNPEQNFSFNAKSHPMQIICCEQGTECKLYISTYNKQNEKIVDITIYQDTTVSTNSEIEVLWTNPSTGDVDRISFSYSVEARAIMDLFI